MEKKEITYFLIQRNNDKEARGEEDLFLETFSVRDMADYIEKTGRDEEKGDKEREKGRDLWQRMAMWKKELKSAQGLIDKGTREQEVKKGGSREERQEEAQESRAAGVGQQNTAHSEMHSWTKERGVSKMWKLYKEEELEKLKKRTKGSTLKHMYRIFFNENQCVETKEQRQEQPRRKKMKRAAAAAAKTAAKAPAPAPAPAPATAPAPAARRQGVRTQAFAPWSPRAGSR